MRDVVIWAIIAVLYLRARVDAFLWDERCIALLLLHYKPLGSPQPGKLAMPLEMKGKRSMSCYRDHYEIMGQIQPITMDVEKVRDLAKAMRSSHVLLAAIQRLRQVRRKKHRQTILILVT